MQAPSIPATMTQDIDAITAKFDADYAICLRQQRVQFNQNAVDFSFLCEDSAAINKGGGKKSDDAPTWSTFVEEVKKRLNSYAEFRQRAGTVQADVDRRIVINLKLTAQEINQFIQDHMEEILDAFQDLQKHPAYKAALGLLGGTTELFEEEFESNLGRARERYREFYERTDDAFAKAKQYTKKVRAELRDLKADIVAFADRGKRMGQIVASQIGDVAIPKTVKNAAGTLNDEGRRAFTKLGEAIANGASATWNSPVAGGIMRGLGKFLKVFSYITAAINIYDARGNWKTILTEAAGLAGGIALGALALPLAAACGPAAPVCFVIFFVALSTAGAEGAKLLAEQAAQVIEGTYDFLVE